MALATVRAFGGRTRRPALRNGFLNLGAIDLPCPFFFLILPISIIQGAKHPENTWPLNHEYQNILSGCFAPTTVYIYFRHCPTNIGAV